MSDFFEEIVEVRKTAELIHDEDAMREIYDALAEQISESLSDSRPLLLPVMLGGLYLCGQLMSRLDFPLEIDYLHATRYRDKLQGDDLYWQVGPSDKISGRTVLLIDDILDQGVTLSGIIENLKMSGVEDIQSVVLCSKQCSRQLQVDVTFKGVNVPDRYVFGCGMDYKGYWRNLPQIYAVA
ncbi:MAG: hypoxanthine-guanine phosphoribosyltransferase [Arenicellales bacterium]|jgi:hypoxanthine phosphoribosyltransferase